MAITCTPLIDIKAILQPMLMSAVLRGEEIPIDALVTVYMQDAIVNAMLKNITLPSEFAELGEIICLQLEMNKVKTVLAVLRGEEISPEEGIEKIIELVVNLQLLAAMSKLYPTS